MFTFIEDVEAEERTLFEEGPESAYSQQIYKLIGWGDTGRMKPQYKSDYDDKTPIELDSPDFGWDNYETLSPRWDDGDWTGAYEHPYDFLKWIESHYTSLDAFVEEAEYDDECDPDELEQKEIELQDRIALKEHIEESVNPFRLGYRREGLKINPAVRAYWNHRLAQVEAREKAFDEAINYALYEWEDAEQQREKEKVS